MRERRTDDDFRLSDNRRRANSHRIERTDDEFRSEEDKRRVEALKVSRQNDELKEEERKRNALIMINSRTKYRDNFDDMKSDYELKIKEDLLTFVVVAVDYGSIIPSESTHLRC